MHVTELMFSFSQPVQYLDLNMSITLNEYQQLSTAFAHCELT